MFTGIISATAKVAKIKLSKTGMILTVMPPRAWHLKKGSSVAVNGVCSTVKSLSGGLVFDYMPESLNRSSLSSLHIGDTVNLERSFTASAPLDGHIVQGHVDATGTIASIVPEGNSYIFKIHYPIKYSQYVVEKGSIALDGISLTVAVDNQDTFSVKIIPFTWDNTNMGKRKVGDKVNLEFDVLAKYLAKIFSAYQKNK